MKSMRSKATIFACVCFIMCFALWGASAKASGSGSLQSGDSNVNVTLMGFVTFVKGVLVLPDRVTYTATISGPDTYLVVDEAEDVRVYVTPRTDKHSYIGSIFLYYTTPTVSGTNVSCGTGGTKALLDMYCVGAQRTLDSDQ